ncbi:hypothetical protein [Devosia sp. FJ2-5-3]|uniref:hypothetical protein n=1 Tax=Devosia sp. FJ2-5-3 TaxID=2976680 RepID=UPI0023D7E5D8|nr:hypothetical protein [Devosia sp. FJ2-5-3]WEJ60183.1 hypothetical protein N0P34_09175 [Devosia sp. FJ2-5-3]
MADKVKLTKQRVLDALVDRALDIYDLSDKLGMQPERTLVDMCKGLRDEGLVDWMYREDALSITPAGRAALENSQ